MPDAAVSLPARAALYLRSSKDRSDVSPAAQRHALEELARSKSLTVAATFEDVVESGSSEDRPGFLELLRAVKDPRRGWSHLLVYDTSRLARRRYIAQAFKHELKKRGITLLYATIPELDQITDVVVSSMFEAMDEVHSLMSREKGLAGMAENVRQGYRAGGRAPIGYQLKSIPTGAVRDGKPVTKSRLELGPDARAIAEYLKLRAAGVPRVTARRNAGVTFGAGSLVGVEWNALTYAGHTVWNVHRESGSGTKRRPRSEWHMRRDTHPALITDREAESIIAQLETSTIGASIRAARMSESAFMLSGILWSTDGRAWFGQGKHYRLRAERDLAGKFVRADRLESAVARTLNEYRTTDAYRATLLEHIRRAPARHAPGSDLVGQIRKLERERDRAASAAIATDAPQVYEQLVTQRTRQIEQLRRELAAVETEAENDVMFRAMTPETLSELLTELDPRDVVRRMVDRVVLEPSLTCQIRLRDPSYNRLWREMASPRGPSTHPQGVILNVAL